MRRNAKHKILLALIVLFIVTLPRVADAQRSVNGSAVREGRGERSLKTKPDKPRVEHFRFGPLLGVGFPRPFAIEGMAKLERVVGVGFEYSFMPSLNVVDVDVSFRAFAADVRVFPLRGAFFFGARVGRQWLDARTRMSAGRLGSFTESMDASTWFVNPRAGFLFTFDSGITIGIDAGVQIPIDPMYRRSGAATAAGLASGTSMDQMMSIIAKALGNQVTPTIDLLRLGVLF